MLAEKKKSIAIIVRKNRDVERLLSLCEANGISASAERGADIFSHPIGMLFFSMIEFMGDPSKTEALGETLASGLWGLDFAQSVELIKKIKSGDVSHIIKTIPSITLLQKQIDAMGGIEYLTTLGEVSGLTARATESPLSAEVWRSIIALARDVSDKSTVDNPRKLIEALLSYRASAENKSVKISTGRADAQVHIMTAHGSKGLEYDYVFLPYATEETWMAKHRGPSFILPKDKGEGDEIRDARRLFYVALTRARSHATVLYGLEEGLGRILTPLRFISELDSKHTRITDVPFLSEIPRGKNLEKIQTDRESEYIEYAKRMLIEKGLSVTALNHFTKCPSAFFYKSIVKIPEPPSASSEKGNAMHEALSEVWKLKEKTEQSITKTIQDVIQAYFVKSLLAKHEKEVVVEELLSDAPLVAAALLPHFESQGTVLAETWAETEFEGKYGDEPVKLRLHGKLDAILDTTETVRVFDYKTKESMSTNEIKGLTKNSDGGYFRQLAYYKMLLANNPRYKGKAIEPALVFVKPDEKGRCQTVTLPIEDADIEKVRWEIQSLIQSVWSGAFLRDSCEETDCQWCKMKALK